MKKHALLLAALLAFVSSAWAAAVTVVNNEAPQSPAGRITKLVDAQTVASTGTYSSDAYDQAYGIFSGLWYQCVSASSTPNVQIDWLESPTTESTEFVAVGTAGGAAPIVTAVTTETAAILSLQPPPMRYGRLRLTGISGNPSDTVCNVYIFSQGLGAKS
jgi:hypothetical protein